MKAGKAIFSILSTDATVSATVTESGVVKVFPIQIPQRTNYPAIVYNIISNQPHDTKTGVSRFDQIRVQIDCYAKTYTGAATLDDAVRVALDRKAPGAYGGVVVKGLSYINTNETLTEADNVYRISTDYQIIIDPFI